jgi:hypothetical protein
MVGGDMTPASAAPDCSAAKISGTPPTWMMLTSRSGSRPLRGSTRRATVSVAVPRRVTATRLPRRAAMLVVPGEPYRRKMKRSVVEASPTKSAPARLAVTMASTPELATAISPASMAWVRVVLVAM